MGNEHRYGAIISETAHFLPERIVTNAEIEQHVDTSDEWIRERTGIVERRFLTDIAAPDFDAEAQAGLSYSTLMATIHARLPDGTLITGVEVFRQLYGRVGLKSLMPLTRIPGIKQGLDVAYEKFAKNRLRLTGRCEEEGVCQVSAGEATQRLKALAGELTDQVSRYRV